MTATPDTSGVRVPPPLWFAGAILVGWLIHRAWPLRLVPRAMAPWIGVVVTALSAVLAALSFREFARAKTSPIPDRPTTAIIREGPYRYSRNPLYVALALLQIGIAFWVNSVFILLMLIPPLVVISRWVIAREEAYLERKFGASYLDYKASVRRWI